MESSDDSPPGLSSLLQGLANAPEAALLKLSRFDILRRLGAGGMGVVYEAYDKERRARVALKTLRTLEPQLLLRFKDEFRALQGIEHPNLVTLLELINDGGNWFFTMELVEGVDLLTWICGPALEPDGNANTDVDTFVEGKPADSEESARISTRFGRFDEMRLRNAFAQLAGGLQRLHRAGKVHRDVKPLNILVDMKGRVVVLDFGLVAEWTQERDSASSVVGTVHYMAPEQAAGRRCGPEADWYSVGVMLYEGLTGRLPFRGPSPSILEQKQRLVPPAPNQVRECPSDLNDLCMELLRISPAARPNGAEIVRRFGGRGAAPSTNVSSSQMPFFGRARELELMRGAFEEMRRGQPGVVVIEGASGVGKSALVRTFTHRLATEVRDLVVLAGRYHEREAMPYRALDSIMDSVSRFLMKLPPDAAEAALPLDFGLLAHVFPSLRAVEAVSRAAIRQPNINPQELRKRVFLAVRELFLRIARRRPVVLVVDDVQWADPDSRAVFGEAMRPPDGPVLLAIATYRTSSDDDGAFQRTMSFLKPVGAVHQLHLGHLPPEDARALAARLLGSEQDAAAIAEEADGHPLFIDALVGHTLALGRHTPGRLRLDDALGARIDALDPSARTLVELIALAAGPLPMEEAFAASRLDLPAMTQALSALRSAHLSRQTRLRDEDAYEPYHDRVREQVLARLDDATRRQRHEQLARAFEAGGRAAPERLFLLWRGAGNAERTVHYGTLAAAHAGEVLAFEQATRLYAEVIQLAPEAKTAPEDLRRLRARLGAALANAGHGAEAAAALKEAVAGAPPDEALDLQRRAAEQLLRSGRIDDGLLAVQAVLTAVGLTLPATPRSALASLLWNRARLRLRGLGYKERTTAEIPKADLTRVDACWSMAGVLGMVDTIRGANFQTVHIRLALRAGEPFRVARALGLEVAYSSVAGLQSAARTAKVLAQAEALTNRLDDVYLRAWTAGVGGVAAALEGRFATGLERCQEAERIFREQCGGVAWELSTFQFFIIYGLAYTGRITDLCKRVPRSLREAEARGDLYGAAAHRAALANMVWLAADDVVSARKKVQEAMQHWSRSGFQLEHFWGMLADGQTDLYAGDPEGYARLMERWKPLSSSLLLRIQLTRMEAAHLRGRAALAAARAGIGDRKAGIGERKALLASVRGDARRMIREGTPWATPLGKLLLAGAAATAGDVEGAAAILEPTIALLDGAGMALYAAAARRQLGLLRRASDGAGLVAGADEWMVGQSIVKPDRMAAMLVPGF